MGCSAITSCWRFKSALDGFAAIPFAASLGPGVLLSVGTVAVVQGGLATLAMGIGGGLGDVSRETPWVIELTATGGIVILGIGLSLLELKKIQGRQSLAGHRHCTADRVAPGRYRQSLLTR